MYLTGVVPTLAMAAESCGSTVAYITSAITVLKTEDPALMTAVLDGRVKLYAAAQAMKPLANLLSAYRNTDSSDRFAFTQAVGTAEVWDRLIMPALESDTNAGRKEVPTQI